MTHQVRRRFVREAAQPEMGRHLLAWAVPDDHITHLLDDEYARLAEGDCPFPEAHKEAVPGTPEASTRLTVVEGWGRCSLGTEWRTLTLVERLGNASV